MEKSSNAVVKVANVWKGTEEKASLRRSEAYLVLQGNLLFWFTFQTVETRPGRQIVLCLLEYFNFDMETLKVTETFHVEFTTFERWHCAYNSSLDLIGYGR